MKRASAATACCNSLTAAVTAVAGAWCLVLQWSLSMIVKE